MTTDQDERFESVSDEQKDLGFTRECVRRLGYHPVQGDAQRAHFEENRRRFMELYDYLATSYEPSCEVSLALTALQEACMWANAHVACNDVGVE